MTSLNERRKRNNDIHRAVSSLLCQSLYQRIWYECAECSKREPSYPTSSRTNHSSSYWNPTNIQRCLRQFRQDGGIMFSTCPFVRPSVRPFVTKLMNTIFWKRMNWFCSKLAQVIHAATGRKDQRWWGSWGQRSRSHDAEVRFGDLAEPSFSIHSVELCLYLVLFVRYSAWLWNLG